MMFNVHTEGHNRLEGYFVPNSFSAEAVIRVTGAGQTLYVGPCDEVISDLVKVGRHETGLASFSLDGSKISDLPEIDDLCVYDDASGFLIYRRNQTDHFVQRRLFRLETTLAASSQYTSSIMPHFAYGLAKAHLFGQETVSQLFNLSNYPSMYFEGRVHIKPHQKYLTEQIFSVVSVEDPFIALAMTLEGICQEGLIIPGQLDEREFTSLLPLAGYFDGIDMSQPERIRRHLSSAPKSILRGLESPLVGLLTSQTPGKGGGRRDIPGALDILSMFDMTILGCDARQAHIDLVQELGILPEVFPEIERPKHVLELAEALRGLSVLENVLEQDLIVYHCLKRANSDATHENE